MLRLQLEKELFTVVKGAMSHLNDQEVHDIVDHLTSPAVGVTEFGDLKDMSVEFLPTSIPPLKRKQLLAALQAAGKKATGNFKQVDALLLGSKFLFPS